MGDLRTYRFSAAVLEDLGLGPAEWTAVESASAILSSYSHQGRESNADIESLGLKGEPGATEILV